MGKVRLLTERLKAKFLTVYLCKQASYYQKLKRKRAEREGFKPPVPVTVHLISNQAHSITLTPLRIKMQCSANHKYCYTVG